MKKIVSLVVCFLLLGSLVCFTGCGSSDVSEVAFAQGGGTTVKWEYKFITIDNIGEGGGFEIVFNKLGSEGWELVCIESGSRNTFFKRRK
jgi:hypothetical protein